MATDKTEISAEDELAFSNEAREQYEDDDLEQEEKEFEELANSSEDDGEKEVEGKEDELPPKDDEKKEEDSFEQRFKDTQGEYTKSQQAKKELESELGDLSTRLDRLGGVENIEKYLAYLQNDPDFVALLNQKRDKQNLGINEEGLTPEAKEVLALVKKIAKAEVLEGMDSVRGDLNGKIDPYIEAAQDRVLSEIYDRMDENYGDSWSDELETIQELSKDWTEDRIAKLKYTDVEELYIVSLKRNGKFDKFAEDIYSKKIAETKRKATPRSRSGSVIQPPKGKVRNMFDAAKRAELKANKK